MSSSKRIKYDLNTEANLEVEIKGIWYRVTPCEFRSFNGSRRINGFAYLGPIYYKQTNDVVPEHALIPLINYPDNYQAKGTNNNNIRRRF